MTCGTLMSCLIFDRKTMEKMLTRNDLIKLEESLFEIPTTYRDDMRVPARIFVNEKILEEVLHDRSLWQLVNVTTLPGIVNYAFAMPDIHEGYGFPIGGVAATRIHDGGVISPGGIGYDINCGVRLLVGAINADEIKPHLETLATSLWHAIPSGVGRGGTLKLSIKEIDALLRSGAKKLLEQGFGMERDLAFCEEQGCMTGADPTLVSDKAKERGHDQLGTLGSGNHFLELQRIDTIFDQEAAQAFGLYEGAVTVMIHCGSRGLGHQVCTDYVREMMPKIKTWGLELPDRELVCAPFTSPEGQQYFAAMQAAANFAWANRFMIAHNVRKAWHAILGNNVELSTVYDVSHNIGKQENHMINNKETELLVHRKGATRAFGPGRPEVPGIYRHVGQPVLIPGTMGTASYILVGTKEGMELSFGSCCHGAGRRLSRMRAKKEVRGSTLRAALEKQGIIVRCESNAGLAEEAPSAYKDVETVVDSVQQAKLARKVARAVPLAVIKG